MSSLPQISIAVVGAGISGLASAFNLLRSAKRTGKSIRVVLYDKNPSPGGTWSTASVYTGLITNNSWSQMLLDDDGQAEKMFMEDPSVGAGPGGFRATGDGMIHVMEHAARQVCQLGGELRSSTEIVSVVKLDGISWQIISTPVGSPDATVTEIFDKLIVATGSFSDPIVPDFAAPFVHPNRTPMDDPLAPFAIHTSHLSEPTVQTALFARRRDFVVVGASKSALDAAERLALNGCQVTLVLRNPPYLAPPSAKHPKTGAPADAAGAVGTRKSTSLVPYFKDPVTGLRSTGGFLSSLFRTILHTTWLGSFLHRRLVATTTKMFSNWGGWSLPLSNAMKPSVDMMWSESSMFPGPASLPDLIRSGKISLIKGAITNLQKASEIREKDAGFLISIRTEEEELITRDAHAVIFGTGWRTGTYPFFSPALIEELGLPIVYTDGPPKREAEFIEMDERCLNELLKDQKTLATPPKIWEKPSYSARQEGKKPVNVAPYRLFRLMVPLPHLQKRDIAFPGVPTCKANHVLFLVQGHWIADYFLDTLPNPLPCDEVAKKEISMQAVWSRRLFGPAHGRMAQWLGAVWIEYCGRLCNDMGVPGDGMGLTGVVHSGSYNLEEKRTKRDLARGINVS